MAVERAFAALPTLCHPDLNKEYISFLGGHRLMTISLPGSSRKGLTGLFKRSANTVAKRPMAKKQLGGSDLAKLFDKQARTAKPVKPAKLSEGELNASEQLSSLRGALYSKS
jgi:hypothetical protein